MKLTKYQAISIIDTFRDRIKETEDLAIKNFIKASDKNEIVNKFLYAQKIFKKHEFISYMCICHDGKEVFINRKDKMEYVLIRLSNLNHIYKNFYDSNLASMILYISVDCKNRKELEDKFLLKLSELK